jgi:nitrile hydratase subunit beta
VRVFALHLLVELERLGARPGGRATREQMAPVDYLAPSYYERWLWSVEQGLLRKGTITAGEVEHMMERLGAGGPEPPAHRDPEQAARAVEWLGEVVPMRPATRPRFVSGQRVRVRRMRPAGHTRCPRYVRGALGVVEGVRGAEELPDLAVYSKDAPVEPVYSVALRSDELWGQARNSQEL